MIELLRTADLILISALKAALSAEGVTVFEFDGEIASTYGGIEAMPRRLMVQLEDHALALEIAMSLCPDYFED